MTITATRRLQFASGHRIYKHESKCANVHGHNYVVEITAQAPLDSLGRVIDFSVLKRCVGQWIDDFWDHGFIVYEKDDEMLSALRVVGGKRFIMDSNPTAENMARFLLEVVCPQVLDGTGVTVVRILLRETENCWAEVGERSQDAEG